MNPITRFALASLLPVSAAFCATTTNPETFTKEFLTKLQAAKTGHEFAYKAPLEIDDTSAPEKSIGTLYLDRIYGFSQNNPQNADAAITSYLRQISQVIADRDRPIATSDILLVVRHTGSINRSLAQMGTGPKAAFPRKLTEGLTVLPAINTPSTVKYVNEIELKKLTLTEDQLFSLAKDNLRKSQKPLSPVANVPPKNAIGSIREEFAASRLIFIKDWDELAKAVGGDLIVMVPAFDTILYGDGSTKIGIDALRTLAKATSANSQVPLSEVMLRYKGDHWEEVP